MLKSDQMIEQLLARLSDGCLRPDHYAEDHACPPPVVRIRITQVEQSLDLRLPPFLVRLYTDVADGGFGPDYGLLSANGDSDVDLVGVNYQERALDDWPRRMLIIGSLGCRLYHCVDVESERFATYLFDADTPNDGVPIEQQFLLVTESIEEFYEAWLSGNLPFPSHPE